MAGGAVKAINELAELGIAHDWRWLSSRDVGEQQGELDFRAARVLAGKLLALVAQRRVHFRGLYVIDQTHDRSARPRKGQSTPCSAAAPA